MSCNNCPIQHTKYCHMVNPEAKKLTRHEKEAIAEMMKLNDIKNKIVAQ